MYSFLLPSKLWFFMITSSILIFAPITVFADDGNISSCGARFRCGNIQNIGYPFWGLDRPEGCGHPGFMLNCNENTAEITIMAATYRVLGITSASQILEVARIDYSDNICPTYLINSTFSSSLFSYYRNTQDIRLYYGCQPLPGNLTSSQLTGLSSEFECSINNTDVIGYYVTRDITAATFGSFAPLITSSLGSCNQSVIIPVLNSEIQFLEVYRNTDTLKEALTVGFELQWSANDSLCSSCLSSSGQCGHNITSGEFICYCKDGSNPDVCPSSPPGKSPFLSCLLVFKFETVSSLSL